MSKINFEILGISENASEEEIKSAYKTLVKNYHPDLWVNASKEEQEKAKEKMQEINKAYKEIMKDLKRKQENTSQSKNNFHSKDGTNFQQKQNARDINYKQKMEQFEAKLKQTEEKKKIKMEQLRGINSTIWGDETKRNHYVMDIKNALIDLTHQLKQYFSSQISSNNSRLVHRLFEGKRQQEQSRILAQEQLILNPFQEILDCFPVFDLDQMDFEIFHFKLFSLTLVKEILIFLQNIVHVEKELNTFIKRKDLYYLEYQNLDQSIKANQRRKEDLEFEIKELDELISSVEKILMELKCQNKSEDFNFEPFFSEKEPRRHA